MKLFTFGDFVRMAIVLACFSVVLGAVGCGSARGSGVASAMPISGPYGVKCYAILNALNEPIGGNCIKE